MWNHLTRLTRHSIVYGLGTMSIPIVNFLLIPIYTRRLSEEDYGILALFSVTLTFVMMVTFLGLPDAMLRFLHQSKDEVEQKEVVGTALIFSGTATLLICAVLIVAGKGLSSLLFGSSAYSFHFLVIFLTVFLDTGFTMGLNVFRARQQSSRYLAFSLGLAGSSVGLKVLFLVVFHKGVLGLLEADLLAAFVFYVLLLPFLAKRIVFTCSWPILRGMLSFGLPLVPASIAGYVMVASDRYFLQLMSTTEEVGLYSLGYSFGRITEALIVSPLALAWMPFALSVANEKNAKQIYSSVLTYYAAIGMSVVLALSLLSEDVIRFMCESDFYDAHKVVPLIAVSYFLNGIFLVLLVGVYLEKKTRLVPLTIGAAAIANLGLNYLLVPRYGMMGAAGATVISYLMLPVVVYLVSRRYYAIRYDFSRVARALLAGVAVYVASIYATNDSLYVDAALRAALLLTYPVLLYLLRFYTPGELEASRRLFSNAWTYAAEGIRLRRPFIRKRKP